MFNKIRIYNVRFGDCFLLYDDNYKIMVDCGTISELSTLQNVIDDLNVELSNDKVAGMITHFHLDHYKILESLKKQIFDRFYLSNFFF